MNRLFERVDWSVNANIYEINLRQYSQEGTFTSFIRELPRLKDMGITILWFMPITPISLEKRLGSLGSYYACSSYLQTNPEYGTIQDFKQLVRSIHDLGMKVIIDWVANHTGWDHEWT
ncbi:MAG TPA: alpha-amylase family glycosyl hydrolase, partial [Flavitalea sp.]|nr:alpha-amylase family glycosyl hydrolase [Flavitalea sp.]